MTEKTDQGASVVETLTDEEQKVLCKALKKVEAEVFHNVLKRLSALIAVVLSIFLIGGLVNLGSCYSNIENSTAQKLASDPDLRDKIINKVQESQKDMQEKLKGLNERTADAEKENARAAATFFSDLEEIRFMVERINHELSSRLRVGNRNQPKGGIKKK